MNRTRILLTISCVLQLVLLTKLLPLVNQSTTPGLPLNDANSGNLLVPTVLALVSLAIQSVCLAYGNPATPAPDVVLPAAKTQQQVLVMSDHLTVAMTNTFRNSSSLARKYLDSMPVGLFSTDENGVVLSANIRAVMFMGTSIENLIGARLNEFVRLPDVGDFATFQVFLEHCSGRLTEATLIRKDGAGGEVPVEVSLAEFEGPAGRGYIMNVVDLSDRHEVERLKQEFLSIVSHDLRTPLTSIQLFLESLNLEITSLPEHFRRGATNSEREVRRLIRLVSSLLDIAKIRAGKLELAKEPFQLQPFLDRLNRSLSNIAQGKVVLRFVPSDDFVVADEDRVYQVMENLIGNAIKFAPADSEVVVEVTALDEFTRFEVRDFGPGVPADKQSLIFESFAQVCTKDATVRGGSGLGLAICKLIVEQHGGTIGVDSALGKGSCFWFTLPD